MALLACKPTRRPVLPDIPSQIALAEIMGPAGRYLGDYFWDGFVVGIEFPAAREILWCDPAAGLSPRPDLSPSDPAGRLILARWILADAFDDCAASTHAQAFASDILAGLGRFWSLPLAAVDSWFLSQSSISPSPRGGF